MVAAESARQAAAYSSRVREARLELDGILASRKKAEQDLNAAYEDLRVFRENRRLWDMSPSEVRGYFGGELDLELRNDLTVAVFLNRGADPARAARLASVSLQRAQKILQGDGVWGSALEQARELMGVQPLDWRGEAYFGTATSAGAHTGPVLDGERANALFDAGKSVREVASALGVSKSTAGAARTRWAELRKAGELPIRSE